MMRLSLVNTLGLTEIMATKADLESREAACNSAEDLTNLAKECLTDPVDLDYAKDLLEKAEGQCQFPVDSVRIAELYAAGDLEDQDHAKELYEQAEDACFEDHEFAEVGASLGKYMGELEKGKELIEKSAAVAKTTAEFMTLANFADSMGDSDLAKTYLEKVEGDCKTVAAYSDLVKGMAADNPDTAKALYKKAARYAIDIDTAIEYATGIKSMFDDTDWAGEVLSSVEGDCQFPKEFVDLSKGYKDILDNTDKVAELLEQGGEFAMAEDEFQALAEGYWQLLGDKQKAAEAYDKVIGELNDRSKLLDLAKVLASELEDKDRAKKVYAKVEAKTASALDLGKLAQAVCDDLQDKDYAAEIYDRAAEKMTGANDFINLAGEVAKNLADQDRANVLYEKAIEKTTDFNGFIKLLDAIEKNAPDATDLRNTVLANIEEQASATGDYLTLASRLDKEAAKAQIKTAENGVASLEEIRKVVAAVEAQFADDADWIASVKDKLEKREANQVKYVAFQKREKDCTKVEHYLNLVSDVMTDLGDQFYARKLLSSAEDMLNESAFDFNLYESLAIGIDQSIQDQDWVKKIFDFCAQKASNFTLLRRVGTQVSNLSDKSFGQGLAKSYYENYANNLSDASSYDYGKLANAVTADLGDAVWAKTLLGLAVEKADGHAALAYSAAIAKQIGDTDLANDCYSKALDSCDNAGQLAQLGEQMRSAQVDSTQVQNLYNQGLAKLSGNERLRGIESIMTVFNDRDWTATAYNDVVADFSGADKKLYKRSRLTVLDKFFFRAA